LYNFGEISTAKQLLIYQKHQKVGLKHAFGYNNHLIFKDFFQILSLDLYSYISIQGLPFDYAPPILQRRALRYRPALDKQVVSCQAQHRAGCQ